MTPNQYIITEERLKEFEKSLPKYCMTPDHFIIDRDAMIADVRSHPYQSEREKIKFAGEPALTEIEIALRKEESPSENVQWAIERLNQVQGYLEEAMTLCIVAERASERDKVLDDAIHEISQAAPEMEGKKLFITVLALCRRIDKLRQDEQPPNRIKQKIFLQELRQVKLEQVLDELEQWVKLGNDRLDKAYPNDRLMKKIKELRRAGEP